MLGVVIAHGKAQEVVDRHMPNWQACFDDIIIVSPRDDLIAGAIPMGKSCHHGDDSINRMIFACALAAKAPFAAVLEYDTLVWGLEQMSAFNGAVWCSALFKNGDSRFEAGIFGHSPWVANQATWDRVLRAGATYQEYPDRWLALAAQNAGVPLGKLPQSFSCDAPWGDVHRDLALQAKRTGAFAIHGFKDKETFDLLTA